MQNRCFAVLLLAACGDASDAEEGIPIVDRAPRPGHECAITHEPAVLLESQPQLGLALARTEAGWVAAHGSQDPETFEPRISLAELRFDPVELARPHLEVPGAGYYARPRLVPRDGTLAMSWVDDRSPDRAGQELRSAVLDGEGELVADPVTLFGEGDEVGIRTHALAAAPDGFGILWSDAAALRFRALDATGAPVGDPVIVSSGPADGAQLIRHGDGFAAVWTDQSGVQLALSPDGGAGWSEPERLAAAGGEETYLSDPFAISIGGELIVAWTEGYRSEDYSDPDGGHALVRLARVSDGALLGTAERLQAAERGIVSALPSLLEIDGTLAIAWTRETYIAVCGGCVSDATVRVLLLDPVDLVPVSETVELVGPSGMHGAPMVGAEDGDVAFLLNVDYHAIADLAAAKIRCAASP